MMDDRSEGDGRLSKYSNADRAAYDARQAASGPAAPPGDAPLTDMLEHLIREGGGARAGDPAKRVYSRHVSSFPALQERAAGGETLPQRLIEELQAAKEQAALEPQREETLGEELAAREDEGPAVDGKRPSEIAGFRWKRRSASPLRQAPDATWRERIRTRFRLRIATQPSNSRDDDDTVSPPPTDGGSHLNGFSPFSRWPDFKPQRERWFKRIPAFAETTAEAGRYAFSESLRWRAWRRRHLTALALVHRHVFDRGIERLLFVKTPPLSIASSRDDAGYIFSGPMPALMLKWAFSALPSKLSDYAFVDFHAGGGRTLLLAAARHFEHAAGYAFDAQSCEELELNLAQYPRSYMACRDVRAVRGDVEGVAIPAQPSVLYFAAAIPAAHLAILLSHVSASYRIAPRPMYLVFEHAQGGAFEYGSLFAPVSLPVRNRIKTRVFGTATMAVYRSAESYRPGATDGQAREGM